MRIKQKVLAYVIRRKFESLEILLFDHPGVPEVNPQVPAGTVEDNEDLIAALEREVLEESGLILNPDKIDYVGSFNFQRTDRDELHKRHVYIAFVEESRDRWIHNVLGDGEDQELAFEFYWNTLTYASENLVAGMGDYLTTAGPMLLKYQN
jgi:8-oxo-dGTP pyrophosphatase MutT (NUDIX family)